MALGENMDWSLIKRPLDAGSPAGGVDRSEDYRRMVGNTMFGFFLLFGAGCTLVLVAVLWLIGIAFGVNPVP